MKKYPPVVIADEHDVPVGFSMLKEAVEKGLFFRVIAVAVIDENGRVLLQKRSSNMEIDPGTWDVSAGGHVDKGQTYESAARLELQEELGITGMKPQAIAKALSSGRFVKMYKLVVPEDIQFTPGANEVAQVKWFTPEEFYSLLHDNPAHCAAYLKELYSLEPSLFNLKVAEALVK